MDGEALFDGFARAASHHGAGWSNFAIATGKWWSETNLGVAVMRQVQATPCRVLILRGNIPNAGVLQRP